MEASIDEHTIRDCWESTDLEDGSKVVVMLEFMESKQSLDDIFNEGELEEGVDSSYRVLDVCGTRRISSFADDFIVLPIGKGSMGYTYGMLSVRNSHDLR